MGRRISIFGATGSIGQSTLDLIGRDPQAYRVVALTGGQNIEQLARDARRFGAEIAVTADPNRLSDLRAALEGTGVAVDAGPEALIAAARRDVDWTMSAIIGAAGLAPGLAALEQGGTLALANKESLVCAGPLVMQTARTHGATILPVDSEHSAIFQCLRGEDPAQVERLQITASGGAFRDWPRDKLREATPEQAATHPNWAMGQRITIDSASLFNKALELIEAHEFFGIAPGRIEALIHPESIVHALVGFADGGVIAHLGAPDMRHAIGHALLGPGRGALPVPRLDLARLGALTFRPADESRHPALRLAREVMQAGGQAGCILNAAKEEALDAFIARRIRFTEMAEIVEAVLDALPAGAVARSLGEVHDMDARARACARSLIAKR